MAVIVIAVEGLSNKEMARSGPHVHVARASSHVRITINIVTHWGLHMPVWKQILALAPLLVLVSCGTSESLLQANTTAAPAAEGPSSGRMAIGAGQLAQGRALAEEPGSAQQPTVGAVESVAAVEADVPHLQPPGRGPLFSKAEDNKPWPTDGTKEAKRQQQYDDRRERELGKAMIICNGC
jgi:hypothetical protein